MTVSYFKPDRRNILTRSGQGFLEEYVHDGATLPVLHVMGSIAEMGRQYGALAGGIVRATVDRLFRHFAARGLDESTTAAVLDQVWERLQPFTNERFIAEMQAIARGAQSQGVRLNAQDLYRVLASSNLDVYDFEGEVLGSLAKVSELDGRPAPMSCTFFAVWGDRTDDGRMFALRNLDWHSQTGMHAERLLTVYTPEDGIPFVTCGYAGLVGALAGMNEQGLSFSEIGAFSKAESLDGTPWTLLAREVLEFCATPEEARKRIEATRHTAGYNYLVAYGDPERFGLPTFAPRALAFETNRDACAIFADNDPKERDAVWTNTSGATRPYGLPLEQAICRADTAYAPEIRNAQIADNGPGLDENDGNPHKVVPLNSYLECHKPMHDMLRAYERGEAYTFPVRGTRVIEAGPPRKLGHEDALNISATVAHNVEKLDVNDWNVMSVLYANTDLDFWVAYESCDSAGHWKNAPDSGYWQFNLAELVVAAPHDEDYQHA